jgi:hypothetical protein
MLTPESAIRGEHRRHLPDSICSGSREHARRERTTFGLLSVGATTGVGPDSVEVFGGTLPHFGCPPVVWCGSHMACALAGCRDRSALRDVVGAMRRETSCPPIRVTRGEQCTSLKSRLFLTRGDRFARDAEAGREPIDSWQTSGPRVQRESPAPRRGRPHPSPSESAAFQEHRRSTARFRDRRGTNFQNSTLCAWFSLLPLHARRSRGATSKGRSSGCEVRAIVCACGTRVCVRL